MSKAKFMTPEDKFKELWNDPTRVRLAMEHEDVSVMQVADRFFMAGYYYCKNLAEQVAGLLYNQAKEGRAFIPPGLNKAELYAVASKVILDLIKTMDVPPEKPKKESMH